MAPLDDQQPCFEEPDGVLDPRPSSRTAEMFQPMRATECGNCNDLELYMAGLFDPDEGALEMPLTAMALGDDAMSDQSGPRHGDEPPASVAVPRCPYQGPEESLLPQPMPQPMPPPLPLPLPLPPPQQLLPPPPQQPQEPQQQPQQMWPYQVAEQQPPDPGAPEYSEYGYAVPEPLYIDVDAPLSPTSDRTASPKSKVLSVQEYKTVFEHVASALTMGKNRNWESAFSLLPEGIRANSTGRDTWKQKVKGILGERPTKSKLIGFRAEVKQAAIDQHHAAATGQHGKETDKVELLLSSAAGSAPSQASLDDASQCVGVVVKWDFRLLAEWLVRGIAADTKLEAKKAKGTPRSKGKRAKSKSKARGEGEGEEDNGHKWCSVLAWESEEARLDLAGKIVAAHLESDCSRSSLHTRFPFAVPFDVDMLCLKFCTCQRCAPFCLHGQPTSTLVLAATKVMAALAAKVLEEHLKQLTGQFEISNAVLCDAVRRRTGIYWPDDDILAFLARIHDTKSCSWCSERCERRKRSCSMVLGSGSREPHRRQKRRSSTEPVLPEHPP